MKVIKLVLLRSIEQGGTTLKDFLQSDGKPGYFAQELQVYGRKGEPCRICGTPVVGTKHAQRATFIAVSARSSLRNRNVCRPGQRSAIWHKDRDRAGVNGPAA